MRVTKDKEVVFAKNEFDKLYQIFASHDAMNDGCNEDTEKEAECCRHWMKIMNKYGKEIHC